MEDKDSLIIILKDEIVTLKDKISIMQGQLEKYTNNERHKRYYEKNKEKVKQNAKHYLDNLKAQNPEKLKEYRHRAYIKRKERNQMDFLVGLS
jgi:hypothetical protein